MKEKMRRKIWQKLIRKRKTSNGMSMKRIEDLEITLFFMQSISKKKEDQNYYLICKNGKHTISIRINSSSSMKKESIFCKHLYKKMEKEIEKLNKQKMNEFKYEFLELYTNDINKKLQKETTGSLQIENDCIILKSTKYNTKKSYHFFSTIKFDDFLSIKQTKLSPSILHISFKQKKYDQIIDTF